MPTVPPTTERSVGTEAVLEESWTTPWLDDNVFPYWPEAAIIGDLEEFLRWLAVQDEECTALVLRHAREFEKVHRLITSELARMKHGTPNHDPSEELAASGGPPLADPATDQAVGMQHVCGGREVEEAYDSSWQRADKSFQMRPCRIPGARRRSICDGHGALPATSASNRAHLWQPGSSATDAERGRVSGQHGSVAVVPLTLKSSRRAFAPSSMRTERSSAAITSSSRRPPTQITPESKRAPRRRSSCDLVATGIANNTNDTGGEDIGDHGKAEATRGRGHVSRVGRRRGQLTWAANTSSEAAGRSVKVAADEAAHSTSRSKPVGRGGGYSERHDATATAESLLWSSPPRPSVIIDVDRNSVWSKRPPRPQQSRLIRSGVGQFDGEGVASIRRRAFENALNSSGSDRNCHVDDRSASEPSTPGGMRRPAPETRLRRTRTRLTGVDGESDRLQDKTEESGNEWLSMRDPISLREFWFDPKTRAAEWEGGEAIEGTPGGVGLGLLSEEERERLKRKIERRRRRGRRNSTAAATTNIEAVGAGHGVVLRQHVFRNLTLQPASERGGAEMTAAAGVPRGAEGGVFS